MARLAQPARSAFDDPQDLEGYDAVVHRRQSMGMVSDGDVKLGAPAMGEYFGAMLNSPRLCALAARMGTFVRTAGERADSYQHWERELVDQVLSADWKTNVVQALHIPDGVAAGVRLKAVEALRYGDEDKLNDDERLLVRYIRQVVSGTVDDSTFAAIRERMGVRGAVEYTGFILWLQWTMRMMQALGVHEPTDAEIDAIIDELRAGTAEPADFRARLG